MFELSDKKLNFQTVQSNTISTLLKACNVNKAVGIDDVSGRFLKDGADLLAVPITQICNSSIKLPHFPKDCKLAKLKPLYKKILRQILKILGESHFYHLSLKFLK